MITIGGALVLMVLISFLVIGGIAIICDESAGLCARLIVGGVVMIGVAIILTAMVWKDYGYSQAMLDHGYRWSSPCQSAGWVKP